MSRSVCITGADMGLGLELVRVFLQNGWRVFAGSYQQGEGLIALAQKAGENLTVISQDVSDAASVRASAQAVGEKTTTLDVLINCAGVSISDTPVQLPDLDIESGRFQRTMEVNAFGPLRVIQAFLPLVENGEKKLIVNVSSEAGSIGMSQRISMYSYCMSKAALNMACKIVQNWGKERGIKVLAIQPGWMKTNMGGPNAEVDPADTAAGIYALVERSWHADDPIYMDYAGKPLPW
jgi:NAD(P)-dependent dehydrogenase (short-subunit alcohol dehydrogenase family)